MRYTRPALTNLPPAMAMLPQRHQRIAMAMGAMVLAFAIYNLVFALGAHPLYSPDEGRYARVSQVMGENGNYLVPMFEGEVRLKKPPLIHWLDVGSMKMLGRTEFAVRLPSLLATLLAAGSVYWLGKKVRDGATGLMAAVLLLVCPLTVVIGRMVLIDPLLNGFWTAAMVCGYAAFRDEGLGAGDCGAEPNPKSEIRNPKYLLLFYGWVALAVFAKGPVGLIPMGIVLVWLMLCNPRNPRKPRNPRNRRRAVLHWHWLVGLVVVSLPLAGWAWAVWAMHPQAAATWREEIVARATGEGDHPRPWWYYLPIALGGFFPMTVLMPLPWLHTPIKRIVENFRGGHVIGYLLVATLLPLVIFSAIGGKLATYILPMGAPMALIAAWYLRNWLNVTDDRATIARDPAHPARRIPDGLPAITITMFVILIGAAGALLIPAVKARLPLQPDLLPGMMRVVLQAMIVPAGLVAAMALFRKGATRVWGLIVAGACLVIAINIAVNVESSLMSQGSVPKLLAKVNEDCAPRQVELNTLGFRDPTFSFYADRYIARLDGLEQALRKGADAVTDFASPPEVKDTAWVIVVEPEEWAKYEAASPQFAARFEEMAQWRRPIGNWLILREKQGRD